MERIATAALCLFLGACAAAPPRPAPEPFFFDARFAPPAQPVDSADIFALSDAMRHYLRVEIAHQLREEGPVRGLIDALNRPGQLKLDYDADRTRNAAEAFAARKGNCLSLVIMTAALARELRLQVTYQVVENGPTWSRKESIAYLNGHVNLTLGRSAVDPFRGYDPARLLTVDFLPAEEIIGLRTRTVGEDRIVAMYMNNRAAEALDAGQLDGAYWWARAAVVRSPDFDDAYNTLGMVYLHHGDLDAAAGVLTHLLAGHPDSALILSNLALVRDRQGLPDQARALRARLAKLEPYPPYHFFFLGKDALARGDYPVARQMFRREVERAGYSGEFHFWLGIADLKLGDLGAAREEIALALENSASEREHALYAGKLERLRSSGGN